jgi:hypothetical protein
MDHRHTERVPGFPACRLFALVDDTVDLENALGAIAPHVEPGAVRVLTGERGIRALDVSGRGRGLRGQTCRILQDLLFSRSSLTEHESHLRRGGHVLLIPAREWAECQQLVSVLGHCAHGLVWFSRCSVVDVTPRHCVVPARTLAVGGSTR